MKGCLGRREKGGVVTETFHTGVFFFEKRKRKRKKERRKRGKSENDSFNFLIQFETRLVADI